MLVDQAINHITREKIIIGVARQVVNLIEPLIPPENTTDLVP
jgi:hypothetical protein